MNLHLHSFDSSTTASFCQFAMPCWLFTINVSQHSFSMSSPDCQQPQHPQIAAAKPATNSLLESDVDSLILTTRTPQTKQFAFPTVLRFLFSARNALLPPRQTSRLSQRRISEPLTQDSHEHCRDRILCFDSYTSISLSPCKMVCRGELGLGT